MHLTRRIIAISALGLVLPAAAIGQGGGAAAEAQTLKEIFALALKNSESIAVSEQAVREAEAIYRQILGASLPELSFRNQMTWEDGSGGSNPEGALRLIKTNLTGYREMAALKAGKSAAQRRKHQRRRAEQLLLGDVAGAFFGLLQAKENVSASRRLIELAERRLGDLRERVRVGRTREADSIGQDFQVASLRSQLEESARQVDGRSNLLAFLIKEPVPEPKTADDPALAEHPLETYLARVEMRPDVQAAKEARDITESLLQVARAEYRPQLSLLANYYPYRPAKASGDWDASLAVGVPLWSWGARRASLSAADAVLSQNELEYQLAGRRANLEIRNAYRDYQSAKKQLELLGQALDLARRDYALQGRDESRGLVTSLEVLESLNRLNGAELAFNRARLQARLAALNLEIAAGVKFEDMELLK